jgi:hypothetical protein
VRYPLIWLGLADACDSRARIENRDPIRQQVGALLVAWHDLFGSEAIKVGDAVKEATPDADQPSGKAEARKALYEVMMELGGRSGKISPTAIGKFVSANEGRIEGGLCFEKAGQAKRSLLWRVVVMDGKAQSESVVEPAGKVVFTGRIGRIKIIKKVGASKGAGTPIDAGEHQAAEHHHPHVEVPIGKADELPPDSHDLAGDKPEDRKEAPTNDEAAE